ncbi:MAG: FAD-binding domain-containing protein, partial [Bacteroidota bacterium]
ICQLTLRSCTRKLATFCRTGVPLIDANMRELNCTGFMSNRGRQNVASFLVHDLSVNWQMGAEYFESLLVDYDPCSNWGNWNYVAGVGSDPRENRYFNILSQARRYDPQGDYVKHWLPELNEIPSVRVHQPDTLSSDEQSDFRVRLGADYPKPMINTQKWA